MTYTARVSEYVYQAATTTGPEVDGVPADAAQKAAPRKKVVDKTSEDVKAK